MAGKYTDLKDFMIQHKTIPEKEWTHTALGSPPDSYPGSYYIEDKDLNLFHNLYNMSVFENGEECHMTEKHRDISPVLIDLDLRHDPSEKKRHYNESFIKDILKIYFQQIDKYIPGIKQEYKKAFVLEKEKPNFKVISNKNRYYKDGLHILLPYIVTEPNIQYLIRYNIIKDDSVKSLFESINAINPVDDIIDNAVIYRNNWQMYGSCKPKHDTYKLTNVYEYSDNNLKKIDKSYTNKDLLKILSIRKNKEIHIVKEDMYTENFKPDLSDVPKSIVSKKKKKFVKKIKSPIKKKKLESDNDLYFVKNIVKLLDQKRSDSYEGWIRLGWCLHNIDYRLLEDWIEFSKHSKKFVDGECEKEWPAMNNDGFGLGIGTLYLWAREDNPHKFRELSDSNLRKCMLNSLSLTPNDIGKVVYNLYKHEFVCICTKRNLWYQFQTHRWVLINDAVELRKRLSKEVIDHYDNLDKFLADEIAITEDDDVKELKRKKKETIGKIIKQLKMTTFKGNIIKECGEFFYDPKFEEKLDTNVEFIGFNNGVYDLAEMTFRDGMPEDYISYSTKINYETYDEEEDEYIDVKKFIEQVLPRRIIREYVMTLMSTFLSGSTSSEKFHIWTGSGGNGKSKLIELFEYGFGDYCCKLPVTLLTQQRARAEGANPALVRTKGKRFAVLQEPEKDEVIQVGLMKELTGGDRIIARALHKDPIEFKPQFKLVMTCNKLIKPSSNDDGVWRRMSVVDFPSRFVESPDPKNKLEFKIDEKLNEKLKIWPEAFIFILLSEYYVKFREHGNKEPSEVKKNNADFKADSDIFALFIKEKIEEDLTNDKGTKIDEIYSEYQEWYRQSYGQTKSLESKKEFKTQLTKKYGANINKNAWIGIKLKGSCIDIDFTDY